MSSTVDAKKLQADESTNKKTDNNKYENEWLFYDTSQDDRFGRQRYIWSCFGYKIIQNVALKLEYFLAL